MTERMWIVPIRFWEYSDLETIEVTIKESSHVYGMHSGYGHNVYVDRSRCFATPEEANREIARLREEYNAELDRQTAEIMKQLGVF